MNQAKKILLVDDDVTSNFLTQRILKRAEIIADVHTAMHGAEALEIVKKTCGEEKCPELILLDINMPVMDGFEFLEELQRSVDLSTANLKIIIMSSSTSYQDIINSRKYPVIDYIEKPLTLKKLSPFL